MNVHWIIIVLDFALIANIGPVLSNISCENVTVDGDELHDYVFELGPRYQWIRPIRNQKLPMNITAHMTIMSIVEIEERLQRITLNAYFTLRWYDEYRVWNNSFPWSCIKTIQFPVQFTQLWVPDLVIYHTQTLFFLRQDSHLSPVYIGIDSDGRTSIHPAGDFVLYCKFDLSFFPFDKQSCRIKFGAWESDTSTLLLKGYKQGVYMMENNYHNEQWEYMGARMELINTTYTQSDKPFSEIVMVISLKRKAGYYMLNVFCPSIALSVITSSTFLVPPEVDNRLTLSFTALLAHSMFHSLISAEMPRSSDEPPLLSIYLYVMECYILIAIILQSISVYLARSRPEHIAKWVKLLVVGNAKSQNHDEIVQEMIRFSHQFDRISLVLYLTLIIATPLITFVVIPNLN